jgi:hypothetical protein
MVEDIPDSKGRKAMMLSVITKSGKANPQACRLPLEFYSKRRMHSIACAPLCPQYITVSAITNVLSKVATAIVFSIRYSLFVS